MQVRKHRLIESLRQRYRDRKHRGPRMRILFNYPNYLKLSFLHFKMLSAFPYKGMNMVFAIQTDQMCTESLILYQNMTDLALKIAPPW